MAPFKFCASLIVKVLIAMTSPAMFRRGPLSISIQLGNEDNGGSVLLEQLLKRWSLRRRGRSRRRRDAQGAAEQDQHHPPQDRNRYWMNPTSSTCHDMISLRQYVIPAG